MCVFICIIHIYIIYVFKDHGIFLILDALGHPWRLWVWASFKDNELPREQKTETKARAVDNRTLFFFSLEQSFSHLKLFWQGWIHVLTLFYSSYNHPLTVMKGNSSDISKPRQWGSFSPLTNWVMGKSVRCPLPQFGGGRGDILSIKWMNELRMCKSITHIIKQIENE